jgi:hypothetical protein
MASDWEPHFLDRLEGVLDPGVVCQSVVHVGQVSLEERGLGQDDGQDLFYIRYVVERERIHIPDFYRPLFLQSGVGVPDSLAFGIALRQLF